MRLLSSLLICTVLVSPAAAQSKAELAAQDARLAQRLTVLEQRFLTGDPAAQQLMQRIDALETTVRGLTGELEQVKYERDNLRNEVKALANDVRSMQGLNSRIQIHLDAVDLVAAETGRRPAQSPSPVSAPVSAPVTSGSPPAGMPPFGSVVQPGSSLPSTPQAPTTSQVTIPVQQQFNDAQALPDMGRTKLAEGDFLGAQQAFSQYLQVNPDAADAGEVSYWLGESHYVRGKYADAADAYIQSMRRDKRGAKAPEAMVRLAGALRELGSTAEACQTLNSFPAQYPGASAQVKEKARVEKARTGC